MFAAFGLFNYYTSVSENPVTAERQRVTLTPEEEIVLGQQARQEIAEQVGQLYPNQRLQAYIDQVGQRVVQQSGAAQAPYPFEFHLLDAPSTINALALPGGQVFITTGLLREMDSEAQLAGVLGHEVGHVVARHGAEHLARQQLGAMLVNAIGIAASDDPRSSQQAAAIARAVNQLVNLNYSRDDELESDRLGLQFMTDASYDPKGLVELMEILDEAQSGGSPPEFFSTHPNPENRIVRIEESIRESYPDGVPAQLTEGEQDFAQTVTPELQ
ncbi:MAG: M48 family metallopeptidase [Nodosilinea sp.]